jgi:hypothetical protein
MRKLNKLAAAIAVALSTGIASQAHAVISVHYDQEGDALLFPVYHGALDNYYTIFNNSNTWMQGHLRFRGAAWSGELLDMDIILSPGDVFAFRVADVDGDGRWELDQSIDIENFEYTGLDNSAMAMNYSTALFPEFVDGDPYLDRDLYPNISDQALVDQEAMGYVEFIGEAVLNGCGLTRTANSEQYCDYDWDGDSDFPLSAWEWHEQSPVEINPAFPLVGNDLDGVGNWLSGQFWIAIPGLSSGMGGAATMFRNFRTDSGVGTHRVDNYFNDATLVPDSEVILHNDNPTAPDDEYIYRIGDNIPSAYMAGVFEDSVSFNNTWGPTLADGDDYNVAAGAVLNYTVLDATVSRVTATSTNRPPMNFIMGTNSLATNAYRAGVIAGNDYYDETYADPQPFVNSLAEVDLALNKNAQNFTSHFFDGASSAKSVSGMPLSTFFFAHYPTKFYRAEIIRGQAPVQTPVPAVKFDYYAAGTEDSGLQHWINAAVDFLLDRTRTGKSYDVEVWNMSEDYVCTEGATTLISPAPIRQELCQITAVHELHLFTMGDFKTVVPSSSDYTEGQVALFPIENDLNSLNDDVFVKSYPGLMYSFDIELSGTGFDLSHWLPMFRSEWARP